MVYLVVAEVEQGLAFDMVRVLRFLDARGVIVYQETLLKAQDVGEDIESSLGGESGETRCLKS